MNNGHLVLFPAAQPAVDISPAFALSGDDASLYEKMRDGYRMRQQGAKHHQIASVNSALATVDDLVNYTRKAPWHWEEGDFEQWCFHLGTERELAVASQRKYQSAIKGFMTYIVNNKAFSVAVRKDYGVILQQICHEENMIPHVLDRELNSKRPALSKAQLNTMLRELDAAVVTEKRFHSKSVYPLMRDYTMFGVMYRLGLRISEARTLDLDDFVANPKFPDFGDFAIAVVTGKGSNGSGPKYRAVPVLDLKTAKLLQWYVDEVRPHLLSTMHPNERALFLSERGTRLSCGAIRSRFHLALSRASLDGQEFCPHSLRHGGITAIQLGGMSLEAARRFAGHAYASTTQGYTQFGDAFIQAEFDRNIH
jgi:site-specific recombinase XerD